MELDKLPFNHDNFAKLRAEVADLRDLTMKLNSALVLAEKKVAPKATPKKASK